MSYPRLVLGALGSFQSVGLYAAAEKIVLLTSVFAGVLDVVLYPIFAKQMQRSVREFARAYERTADLVLVVGLLLAIGLSGLMPEIICMLFGPSYRDALPITLLLVPSISMSILGYVNGRAMLVLRKERLMSVLIIGTALGGLLLASVSVNMFGAMGVALSVLLVATFGFVFYFVYVRTQLGLPWLTGRHILYFALFPTAFLVSFAWRDAGLAIRLTTHLALMAGLMVAFTRTHLVEWRWIRDLIWAFLHVPSFSCLRGIEQAAFFVNAEVEHTDEK
jgi:O-antigen/teichoic acid export membrane protein